jgi:hypothetical protein
MNIELSEQDLKLIRNSLGRFYAELCEEKKIVKSKIEKNPKSILNICNNYQGRLKEINQKLEEILKLENRVFIQNNAPVKKGV